MSGGSYDYFYLKLEEFASAVRYRHNRITPERQAFADLCYKVAVAARAIEWVDSGDNSVGSENEAILKVVTSADVLEQATKEAKNVLISLMNAIDRASKVQL